MKSVSVSRPYSYRELAYPEHLIHSMISYFIPSKQTAALAPPRKSAPDLQLVGIALLFKEQKSADSVQTVQGSW